VVKRANHVQVMWLMKNKVYKIVYYNCNINVGGIR